jgi:hypothetical protein
MSARISLEITVRRDLLRVSRLRGTELRWSLEAERHPGTLALGDELAALMSKAPDRGRGRILATISLDPSLVQIRRLEGFPAVEDPETRVSILREGVRRWFFMRAGGLLTAGPATLPDGSVWGAAFERSAVDGLRAAAEAAGVQVARVVSEEASLDERLAGAAALALTDERAQQRPIPPARARGALLAVAIGFAILLGAYPAALWSIRSNLAASLAAPSVAMATNARLATDLADVTLRLDAIAERREHRVSWVSSLATLSSLLPSGTAAVTLRADSSSGVVVVVGPRAGAAVDAFDMAPAFASPVLVGPVITERIGGTMMERATIGFTLAGRRGARP